MTETIAKPKNTTKKVLIAALIVICSIPLAAITIGTIGAIFSTGDTGGSSSVDDSIASKAKSDLRFAIDHGTTMEACVAASYVAAIYQDQQNVSEYKFYKGIEDVYCR